MCGSSPPAPSRARRHARLPPSPIPPQPLRRACAPARSCCTSPGRAPSTSCDKLGVARPDVELGSLHPLQSLPSAELGVARLPGLVVRGRRPARSGPARDLARDAPVPRGRRRPDRVPRRGHRGVEPPRRAARPGGAPRRGRGRAARGVAPAGARRRSTTSRRSGPDAALTGPVARGDVDTVRAPPRRAARPTSRRRTERSPNRRCRLAGRDDPAFAPPRCEAATSRRDQSAPRRIAEVRPPCDDARARLAAPSASCRRWASSTKGTAR